ncbi:MAG: ABC-three component system protein [Fluviicola sp.]
MSNRNATASWSGYSHQGQVGLFVALREIRKCILNGLQAEFDIYFLEYETREDVAIHKQLISGEISVLSVHQVKAYYSDGHLINTYKDVFTGNPIYQKDNDDKFLRDATGKKIPTGDFEPGQWCSQDNYLHTTVEIGNWPTSFQDFPNDNNIVRYDYESNIYHCGTDEISGRIIEELNSSDFQNGNSHLANLALHRLCFKLDEKIRLEHSSKTSKVDYEVKFSFQELYDIILDDLDVTNNEIYQSRKLFYDTFIEVMDLMDVDQERIDTVKNAIINQINQLDDRDFLLFLQRLNLNESPENLKKSQVYYNRPGLKQVFFKMIVEIIETSPVLDDRVVKYKNKEEPSDFVITAIIEEEDQKLTVVENILSNLRSQNLLWENHSLVNKEIEINLDRNPSIDNISSAEEKLDDRDRFMSFSNSKLVKRDHVTNKLNNGRNS